MATKASAPRQNVGVYREPADDVVARIEALDHWIAAVDQAYAERPIAVAERARLEQRRLREQGDAFRCGSLGYQLVEVAVVMVVVGAVTVVSAGFASSVRGGALIRARSGPSDPDAPGSTSASSAGLATAPAGDALLEARAGRDFERLGPNDVLTTRPFFDRALVRASADLEPFEAQGVRFGVHYRGAFPGLEEHDVLLRVNYAAVASGADVSARLEGVHDACLEVLRGGRRVEVRVRVLG